MIRFFRIERIMTETDAPYVSPEPFRGKRNEPLYVAHVVRKIASIKGIEEAVVKKQVLLNAERLFQIPTRG